MNPGRELDMLIALKIMGFDCVIKSDEIEIDPNTIIYPIIIPPYSTDMNAAWKVMDQFKWAEPEISWSDEQHCWHVCFWRGKNSGTGTSGTSAPHAICLAALESY